MLMKFVLLSFAIALAVAVERHPESEPCAASSEFYVECNKCRCAKDGKGAACTRQLCVPGEYNEAGVLIAPANKPPGDDDFIVVEEVPEVCEAGKKYKVDCNTCRCTNDAKLVCTRLRCVHEPKKRSVAIDYPEIPTTGCTPGKTYRKACNTCFCGKFGKPTCTLMACPADIEYYSRGTRSVEKWGPMYTQGSSCEPGVKFYSECNECRCGSDGKSAACTLKMCPPQQ